MSQSLDLPKNITSFYFWCKIQVLLYIQMKSASHTSIITALKFTCCSSLSVSYQQNCFILRTVHNYLWTRVPTHLCNRIQLLLSLVQMFLLCKTHSPLLAPLLEVQRKRQTEFFSIISTQSELKSLFISLSEHGSNVSIVQKQRTGRRSQNKVMRFSCKPADSLQVLKDPRDHARDQKQRRCHSRSSLNVLSIS